MWGRLSGLPLEFGHFLSSPPESRRGSAAQRHRGGLKLAPKTTIRALRTKLENLWARNGCLELSSTEDRTTPALAAPVPAPPQPRRGLKTSNLQWQAGKPAPHPRPQFFRSFRPPILRIRPVHAVPRTAGTISSIFGRRQARGSVKEFLTGGGRPPHPRTHETLESSAPTHGPDLWPPNRKRSLLR
jgi:hypothetical protein